MGAISESGNAGPSDCELVRAVASGDRNAFAALFGRYAARIKAFMLRSGASEPDADEIAQEVMVSVWQRAGSFDAERAAVPTWIFAIARNRRIDLVRRARRPGPDPKDPLLQLGQGDDGLATLSLAERQARVRKGLATLAPGQREVLRLAFYDGLSHAEVAERTGLPLGTVKGRIRLAFRHLRGALGDDMAQEMEEG